MGWTRLGNGALLRQAGAEFHAVLTADQNIEFQQNLKTLPIAVVVLVANSNHLESLVPLVADVLQALHTIIWRCVQRYDPELKERAAPSSQANPQVLACQ